MIHPYTKAFVQWVRSRSTACNRSKTMHDSSDDIMNWCLHTLLNVNVLLHVKAVVHPKQV